MSRVQGREAGQLSVGVGFTELRGGAEAGQQQALILAVTEIREQPNYRSHTRELQIAPDQIFLKLFILCSILISLQRFRDQLRGRHLRAGAV